MQHQGAVDPAEEIDFDDAFLEQFKRDPKDPAPDWAIKDRENMVEEICSHPLFMKELPADPSENPLLATLQSMVYDGESVEVIDSFRCSGNDAYNRGEKYWPDAIKLYTKGIELGGRDQKLNALLYLNRSAVYLAMENYAAAYSDAAESLRRDSDRLKGWVRVCQAGRSLGKIDESLRFAKEGLTKFPGSLVLKQLSQELDEQKQREASAKQHPLNVLKGLGVKSTTADHWYKMNNGRCIISPYIEQEATIKATESAVYIPVVLLYPSNGQFDVLQKCSISATIDEILKTVFSGPAPWDEQGCFWKHGKIQPLQIGYESYSEDLGPSHVYVKSTDTLYQLITRSDFWMVDNRCYLTVTPKIYS